MRIGLLFAVLALTACNREIAEPVTNEFDSSSAPEAAAGAGSDNPVTACVERGVAYFKEVGSYPTLQSEPNTGRAAKDVALERCQRTTTAF